MTKQEFLNGLRARLYELPPKDVRETLEYYGEMIDDCVENGMSQENAVKKMGSLDEVAAQILAGSSVRQRVTRALTNQQAKKGKGWTVALICVGFPVWFPLLVSAVAVIISLLATLWSVVVSLWACFGAFVGTAAGTLLLSFAYLFSGFGLLSVLCIGAALVCTGLAILFFFGCLSATKGSAKLTKLVFLKLFGKKQRRSAK